MNPMEPETAASDREINVIPPAMHHDPASARQDLAAWETLHREERQAVRRRHAYFYSAGRMLLGLLFIATAIDKLANFKDTVSAVTSTGYPGAPGLVAFALGLELVAGAMLLVGWGVRGAAGWLAIYLIAVTVMLNWDQTLALNRAIALANFGFVAALLMLVAHGPGGTSLAKALLRRRHRLDLEPRVVQQPVH